MKKAFLSVLICLSSFSVAQNKIIYGEDIQISDAPWQVSILYTPVPGTATHCGGVIIDENWILTAGHCLNNSYWLNLSFNDPENYQIHAGSTVYNDYSSGQVVYGDSLIVHQDWPYDDLSASSENDIALIRLATPLEFNENVQPVELANSCNIQQEIEGVGLQAFITGWGRTETSVNASLPEVLQGAFLDIITHEQGYLDLLEFGNGDYDDLHDGEIVFNSDPINENNDQYISMYKGDSGGPAVLIDDETGQIFLIGVASLTEPVGTDEDEYSTPSTYTRVSYYYDWITNKTGISDFSNEIFIEVEGESIIPGVNPDVCYGSQVTMTAHHSGENVSYSWLKNNELYSTEQSISFIATEDTEVSLHVNINDCYIADQVSVKVQGCCAVPDESLDFTGMTSNSLSLTTIESSDIYINNTFVVDNDLTLENCNLILGENAKIIINNASLILNNSTVNSCNDYYWGGIYLDGENDELRVNNSNLLNAKNSIYASNNARLKILDANFTNNKVGIYLENYNLINSNVVGVKNSTFSIDNGMLNSRAIRTDKVKGVKIGNSNPLESNTFSGLYVGFELLNSSVEITNSDFQNIGNIAIYSKSYDEMNDQLNLNVHDNNFNNCTSGVIAFGMGNEMNKIKSKISNNQFSGISNYSIYAKNVADESSYTENTFQGVMYGLRLSNVNTNFEPISIDVSNNTLINIHKTGIWLNNFYASQSNPISVFSNEVEFSTTTSYVSAVKLEGVTGVMANQNTITCTSEISDNFADDIRGMFISETRKSGVYDNIFNNLGQGIHGVGELQLNKFSCNTFNDNYTGFYFEPGIQTVLTDQGSLTYPMDNLWNDLGVSSSNRIYEDGLAQPINWYHRGEAGFDADVNSFTSDISTDGQADGADYCVTIDIDAQINAWEQMVAAGNYTYPQYEEEYKYRDQKTVLRKVDNNPTLYLDDAVIQNFIGVMEGSDLNKVLRVDKRMSEDDLASAIIENQSLLADKLYTQNRKDVNSVYFNYMQNEGELTDDEIDLLESIAYQTPYIGGDAVYSARNLLDIDVTDEGVYYREQESIELEDDLSVSVYPNPSNGLFKINSTQELNRVEVYNLIGRLVKQVDLTTNEFELDLSSESNGIYMVKIIVSGKEIWKKAVKQ